MIKRQWATSNTNGPSDVGWIIQIYNLKWNIIKTNNKTNVSNV